MELWDATNCTLQIVTWICGSPECGAQAFRNARNIHRAADTYVTYPITDTRILLLWSSTQGQWNFGCLIYIHGGESLAVLRIKLLFRELICIFWPENGPLQNGRRTNNYRPESNSASDPLCKNHGKAAQVVLFPHATCNFLNSFNISKVIVYQLVKKLVTNYLAWIKDPWHINVNILPLSSDEDGYLVLSQPALFMESCGLLWGAVKKGYRWGSRVSKLLGEVNVNEENCHETFHWR